MSASLFRRFTDGSSSSAGVASGSLLEKVPSCNPLGMFGGGPTGMPGGELLGMLGGDSLLNISSGSM